jgi:hypothetical protein
MATVPGYRDVLTAYGATDEHTPILGERGSDESTDESAA